MLLFAVTAMEKLKTLRPDVWLKIGLAVGAVIVAVLLWRRIMRMNKIVAGVIIFVVMTVVFFSWVYNRNEPRFLTPVVEKIAPFFPSAADYQSKQSK